MVGLMQPSSKDEKQLEAIACSTSMRDHMLLRYMPVEMVEEIDTHPPDANRALGKMLREVDVQNIIQGCKSPKVLEVLFNKATDKYAWLMDSIDVAYGKEHPEDRFPNPNNISFARTPDRDKKKLAQFGALMFALGAIRGMQLGRELDSKSQGIVNNLLKHKAVRRLLLDKASTLVVCRALDKVERLPWPKLSKQYGTWVDAASQPSVKVAIGNARKAALQQAKFEEYLSAAKGAGDGSIL